MIIPSTKPTINCANEVKQPAVPKKGVIVIEVSPKNYVVWLELFDGKWEDRKKDYTHIGSNVYRHKSYKK